MSKLSRSWLGVILCFVVASCVVAQEYGPPPQLDGVCCDTCCRPPSHLEASASLLFLQPGGGNLEYGLIASPFPVPTPNWSTLAVTPDLTPAFNVGLRYFVPDMCWNIQVNWAHLDASAHASTVADADQFVGPNYEIGPDASLFDIANGDVDFQYDAVRLDVGQVFCSCGPARVRMFAGLEYARIDERLSAAFQDESGVFSNENVTSSRFAGVGPRLGMQAKLSGCRFSLMGEIAGSLLIGRSQSRLDFFSVSPELAGLSITPPNTQALTSPDLTQVTPGIDTKLGGAYVIPIRRSQITIEAGYQAAVYFNALNNYNLSEVVTPPVDQSVGVYLRTAEHLQSNFTAHGPYLTVNWVF